MLGRLLARVPMQWRGAAGAVLIDRPVGFLAILSLAVTGWLLFSPDVSVPSSSQGALSILGTACAIGLARGVVSADRTHERRVMVFQGGGSPGAHYARVMLLSFAVLAGLLLIPAVALALRGAERVGWLLGGSLAWATIVLSASAAVSSLVRGFDLELSVLLLLASLMQGVVLGRPGVPAVLASAASLVLLPIDGMFGAWSAALGGGPWPQRWDLLHAALYPAGALTLTWWRTRNADVEA